MSTQATSTARNWFQSRRLRRLRRRFRTSRLKIFQRLITSASSQIPGRLSILDVGGVTEYWSLLPEEVHEKIDITIVTPGDRHAVERSTPFPVRVLIGDGCDMPHFDDGQFAICHSNSTIEHVGGLQRMMAFAREIQRVSKSFYIQTPYLWFPIEPHFNVPFFGWLPPPTRAQLTTRFSVGKKGKFADFAEAAAFADHCQMIDMFMMKALFPNATIHHERVALLTKSLIAVRDRFD